MKTLAVLVLVWLVAAPILAVLVAVLAWWWFFTVGPFLALAPVVVAPVGYLAGLVPVRARREWVLAA